jgi:hypothetical protein
MICQQARCAKSTASRYARQMRPDKRRERRIDWLAVQAFYDGGNSRTATEAHFKIAHRAWQKAVQRGDLHPRPPRAWVIPIEQLAVVGRKVNRQHLRDRLLAAGLITYECSECGISEWRGKPLALQLDHVDGDPLDNRPLKVRLLCPNCHSQTATFAGRNVRRSLLR